MIYIPIVIDYYSSGHFSYTLKVRDTPQLSHVIIHGDYWSMLPVLVVRMQERIKKEYKPGMKIPELKTGDLIVCIEDKNNYKHDRNFDNTPLEYFFDQLYPDYKPN